MCWRAELRVEHRRGPDRRVQRGAGRHDGAARPLLHPLLHGRAGPQRRLPLVRALRVQLVELVRPAEIRSIETDHCSNSCDGATVTSGESSARRVGW